MAAVADLTSAVRVQAVKYKNDTSHKVDKVRFLTLHIKIRFFFLTDEVISGQSPVLDDKYVKPIHLLSSEEKDTIKTVCQRVYSAAILALNGTAEDKRVHRIVKAEDGFYIGWTGHGARDLVALSEAIGSDPCGYPYDLAWLTNVIQQAR